MDALNLSKLVFHPSTEKFLLSYLENPSQALLLTGPKHIGKKSTLAILKSILNNNTEYAIDVLATNGSISIDSIRELIQKLKLKPNTKSQRIVVTIPNIELMTTEAQNAFLKILEEPPLQVFFIMTADNSDKILRTILSRVSIIKFNSPQKNILMASRVFKSTNFDKYYLMSGGMPGLIVDLINQKESVHTQNIELCKSILQNNAYQRLVLVDEMSKDRLKCIGMLNAMISLANVGLTGAIKANNNPKTSYWSKVINSSMKSISLLEQNVSTKLVLDKFFLSL